MAALGKPIRPIIVIKKKIMGAGHHGGAWKVAYADFMTAMMSLFIVLWLLNSTPVIKKAVAGYFNDPHSGGKETGTETIGTDESITIDQKNVANLKEQIESAILEQKDLSGLSKQIEITITGEGLKIDLMESRGGTFFESGSPKLSETGVKLLDMLSDQLRTLPNRMLIEGHTDAQPYSSDNGYTNWELSSDRANSARRLLQQDGVGSDRISQIRGYADEKLRVPSNPYDPSNRRISLIVQWIAATDPQHKTIASQTLNAASHNTSEEVNKTQDNTNPATAAGSLLISDRASGIPAAQPQPAKSTHTKPVWNDRIRSIISKVKKRV